MTSSRQPQQARTSCLRRFVELLVISATIVACFAAVIVVPEVRRVLHLDATDGAPSGSIVPPTRTNQPASSETTPNAVSNVSLPSGPVDVSGVWTGTLTYVLGDRIENYSYRLELSQDGDVILGKSEVERIEDARDFAEYSIAVQLFIDQGNLLLKRSENNLLTSNNYTSFVPSDPVVSKVMLLH